jgi:2-polyprenyl-3-methyl-5-hydroxy-6-metoxy-1,4-benzoquinol methylase
MINLSTHYQTVIEGERLFCTKANSIEFYTTIHFIEKYLKSNSRIIELGAGHGIYSQYLAEKGHDLVASDIVDDNVQKMELLVKEHNQKNISVIQLDALESSQKFNTEFDMTLCLGPLYHLRKQEEREKCIKECNKITKDNGIIIFAYINRNFAIPYTQSFKIKFNKKDYEEINKVSWNYENFPDAFMNISYYSTPEQMEKEIAASNELEIIDHIAADGIYTMLKEAIEELDENEFNDLLEHHFSVASNPSNLGTSSHNLVFCRKK